MMGVVLYYQVNYVSNSSKTGRRRRSVPDACPDESWDGNVLLFHENGENRTFSVPESAITEVSGEFPEFDFDGELIIGDGACFNNNAVFVELDESGCIELNYNWFYFLLFLHTP